MDAEDLEKTENQTLEHKLLDLLTFDDVVLTLIIENFKSIHEEISLTNNFQSTKLIQTDYNESSYHVRKIYAKKPSSKISKKENSKPQTCSTGQRYTTSYIKGQNISKKSFNYIVITLKNILKQQKL